MANIQATAMLSTIVIGILTISLSTEIFSPLTPDIYTARNVVNKVIATVSSADAPTNNICGIALS